jgi:small subunit ribosomal protein S16
VAVRIRFKMVGRKNRPCFRLVACEARAPRDGRTLELLGRYDPLVQDEARRFTVNAERVRFWIDRGARPTDSARQFLRGQGVLVPPANRERIRRSARKRNRAGRGKAAAPAKAPAKKK